LIAFNSDLLLEKQAETAQIIEEYKRAENELTEMKKKLKELLAKAEKIAPSVEWKERLQQDDVPTTLEEVESEMDEAELKVVSLFLSIPSLLFSHSNPTLISRCVAQLDRRQSSRHPRIREKEARDPRVPG
jgi:chromosome segregation ATPase